MSEHNGNGRPPLAGLGDIAPRSVDPTERYFDITRGQIQLKRRGWIVQPEWTPPAIPVSITTSQGTVSIPLTAYFEADVGTLPAGGSSTFTVRSLNASEGSGGIFVALGGDAPPAP